MDPAPGAVIEKGGSHLAPTGVVDTDEQNLRDVAHYGCLGTMIHKAR